MTTSFRSILRRDQRFMAPVRESINKEMENRLYNGWTLKLTISFWILRVLKYSPFRSYVRRAAGRDWQFLKIIQDDKVAIQNAWNEFEKFFFMNEDCNYANGIFSAGIGNSEEEAKERAKALVLKVKTALDQAGWPYKPIKARVQGYPGWITVEEQVKVWDEVEQFLLHRIRALEC